MFTGAGELQLKNKQDTILIEQMQHIKTQEQLNNGEQFCPVCYLGIRTKTIMSRIEPPISLHDGIVRS